MNRFRLSGKLDLMGLGLALALSAAVKSPLAIAAEKCEQVLSINDVLRRAQRLDGKAVCVRGAIAIRSNDQRWIRRCSGDSLVGADQARGKERRCCWFDGLG